MLSDINKHLMWQLDRLSSISDEDLKDNIEHETKRAKAICEVVKQSVEIANTTIEAHRLANEYQIKGEVLGIESKKD